MFKKTFWISTLLLTFLATALLGQDERLSSIEQKDLPLLAAFKDRFIAFYCEGCDTKSNEKFLEAFGKFVDNPSEFSQSLDVNDRFTGMMLDAFKNQILLNYCGDKCTGRLLDVTNETLFQAYESFLQDPLKLFNQSTQPQLPPLERENPPGTAAKLGERLESDDAYNSLPIASNSLTTDKFLDLTNRAQYEESAKIDQEASAHMQNSLNGLQSVTDKILLQGAENLSNFEQQSQVNWSQVQHDLQTNADTTMTAAQAVVMAAINTSDSMARVEAMQKATIAMGVATVVAAANLQYHARQQYTTTMSQYWQQLDAYNDAQTKLTITAQSFHMNSAALDSFRYDPWNSQRGFSTQQATSQKIVDSLPKDYSPRSVNDTPSATSGGKSAWPYKTDRETMGGQKLAETQAYRTYVYQKISNDTSEYKELRLQMVSVADASLHIADDYYANAQKESGDVAIELAKVALDVALSLTPGVCWCKDVYEAFSGRSLVTGEELDSMTRGFALMGAISGGLLSKVAEIGVVARVVGKVGVALHASETFGKGLRLTEEAFGVGIRKVEQLKEFTGSIGKWLSHEGTVAEAEKVVEETEKIIGSAKNLGVKTPEGMKVFAKIDGAIESLPGALKVQRIREGAEASKVAVVGRSMGNAEEGLVGVRDVSTHFNKNGIAAEIFDGNIISKEAADEFKALTKDGRILTDSEVVETKLFKENQIWAQKLKDGNYTVIDIGNPNNMAKESIWYNMEKKVIFGD